MLAGCIHDSGGFRCEVQQCPNRGARPAARLQFEHLSDEHEHDDDRCRLKINSHSAMTAHRFREKSRREHRHRAVEECRADAERDQREHIEVPGTERLPPALKKRKTRHEDNGRAENGLNPARCIAHHPVRRAGNHVRHSQNEDGQRQARGNPHAAGHVAQLRVIGLRGDRVWLKRHTAFRAYARFVGFHARAHRAEILRGG